MIYAIAKGRRNVAQIQQQEQHSSCTLSSLFDSSPSLQDEAHSLLSAMCSADCSSTDHSRFFSSQSVTTPTVAADWKCHVNRFGSQDRRGLLMNHRTSAQQRDWITTQPYNKQHTPYSNMINKALKKKKKRHYQKKAFNPKYMKQNSKLHRPLNKYTDLKHGDYLLGIHFKIYTHFKWNKEESGGWSHCYHAAEVQAAGPASTVQQLPHTAWSHVVIMSHCASPGASQWALLPSPHVFLEDLIPAAWTPARYEGIKLWDSSQI